MNEGRQRILDAARYLFATQGFHQTAMSELAPAANVSVGQIYRLFDGKSDIIMAIVHEDADAKLGDMRGFVDQVKAGTMGVQEAFTRLAHRTLSEGDEALSFEILSEAHRNRAVSDKIAKLCIRARENVRELACIANPALSEADLDGIEELLLALMFGLGHRGLSRSRLSIDDTAERTGRMIMAALCMDHPAAG